MNLVIKISLINGRGQGRSMCTLSSLDIRDVDTVWTWGKNVPPLISKYFRKFFKGLEIGRAVVGSREILIRS